MRELKLAAVAVMALLVVPPVPLGAQGLASVLTGLSLPEGTKLDRGLLVRMAAKADMDMTAREAGASLGGKYEVYRLGQIAGAQATFAAVKTLVEGQGWTLTAPSKGVDWGWLDRGATRFMLSYTAGKDGAWLYLAEVAERAPPAAATPATTPGGSAPGSTPVSRPAQAPPASSPPAAREPAGSVPVATGPKRFQFTRTDFDDGWVAVEYPDYVQLTREALTAYLYYRVVMTDAMRPPQSNTRDYFWNRDGRPRFDIQNVNNRRDEQLYPPLEYVEGEVTDRATGQRGFAGMFVSLNSGGALNILVIAPDKATFHQAFPKPADVERLLTYNKFAVSSGDLVGTWSESSGAAVQLYYVQTGNYAGMNAAVSSAEWWIQPDGTYRSVHNGATGMVGSQRTFQQEYRGTWKASGNWEVAMTNRFEGKTDTFLMQFEAVKGGRILHLTDKRSAGVRYALGLRQ